MKLSLFVDIYNRKLVKSATSDFPVDLPTLFREDWIDLEITLVEPSGTITSPSHSQTEKLNCQSFNHIR